MMHFIRFLILSALVFPGFFLLRKRPTKAWSVVPSMGINRTIPGRSKCRLVLLPTLRFPPTSLPAPCKTVSPSGDSSALEASLILDDSTYTVLDPSVVEWTFSEPSLSLQNGKLLAEVMPKRTSVQVTARAEGFTTRFTVFILADDGSAKGTDKEHLPEVLRSAIELEASGWKDSEWFGVFYDSNNGWLYHVDHGWVHTAAGGTEAAWFWNEQQQWFWTGPNIYPHLYRNRDAAWLYFFQQALPKKIFYNHQTEALEELADR